MSALDSRSKEPVRSEALKVLVGTVLADLGVLLGVPVSDDLKVPVLGVVSLLAPVLLAVLARRRVFSPATVNRMRAKLIGRVRQAEAARARPDVSEDAPTGPLRMIPAPARRSGRHERP